MVVIGPGGDGGDETGYTPGTDPDDGQDPTDDNDNSGGGSGGSGGGGGGGNGGGGGGDNRSRAEKCRDRGGSWDPYQRACRFPSDDPEPEPDPPNTSLTSVGTTRYTMNDSGENSNPQLQATVYNSGGESADVTVRWFFDDVEVAARSKKVRAEDREILAQRVSYSDALSKLGPGTYRLKAKLSGDGTNGETCSAGAMQIETPPPATPPTSPGGNGGNILPPDFPTLPAVGGLTAEQTTLGALALVGVLVVAR